MNVGGGHGGPRAGVHGGKQRPRSGQALIQPYLAYLWAKRDADIRIEVPDRAKRRARLNRDEAPQPARSDRPVALVLDNGLIHMGNPTAKPPAERAS